MFRIKRSFVKIAIVILLYAVVFTVFLACNEIHRNKTHPEVSFSDIAKGKTLAQSYCQSCHALPDPSLLDSKTWEQGVLPEMGPRLGIFSYNNVSYPSRRFDNNLDENFYPAQPVLKMEEWQNIIDYYIAASPDSLSDKKNSFESIKNNLPLFLLKQQQVSDLPPATTFVKINNESGKSTILISDAVKKSFFQYNENLQAVDSSKTKGAIVDAEFQDKEIALCNIGVLKPNNGKYGSVQKARFRSFWKLQQDSALLFKDLARPVQITAADLNNDGNKDYLICEFGYMTGALSWMENLGNGKFDKQILRPLPGALKAYVQDYNHDGLPDLWVLFAQGEEGIFLFTNKGKGQFDQKEVLRFPPVYGSSYFEFADFNKDGHPDIVYTCGDNADFSTVLKPYHGVYIFMNDGHNNFSQKYFFHINGCFKAMARDFDNDGDLDIAAISFFADYLHRPEESFVYLDNTGNFKFNAFSAPELQQGRWLTMDAGDINGDGKIDLVLGNFSIGPVMIKPKVDWKKGPPFVILQNTGKKNY